jgi:hypothetical protein
MLRARVEGPAQVDLAPALCHLFETATGAETRRDVLDLWDVLYERRPYVEIARARLVSLPTVSKRLHRQLHHLCYGSAETLGMRLPPEVDVLRRVLAAPSRPRPTLSDEDVSAARPRTAAERALGHENERLRARIVALEGELRAVRGRLRRVLDAAREVEGDRAPREEIS